jgi:hypothetical protein
MPRTIRQALEALGKTDIRLLQWAEPFGAEWGAAWDACPSLWWACCLAIASRRVTVDQLIEALSLSLGPGARASWRDFSSDATATSELELALNKIRVDPASNAPVVQASRARMALQAQKYRASGGGDLDRFKSVLRHLFT